MARYRNIQWSLVGAENATTVPNEMIKMALLMDLRDELQTLNRTLSCRNFINIPRTLRSIDRQIKAQRRCPKHPRYTGSKPPTVDCLPCRRFYKAVWK